MKFMMKKIRICIIITLISILFISIFYNICFAEGSGEFDLSAFEESSDTPSSVKNLVEDTTGTAIAIARTVSVAIAVVVLLVIAMRYMISSAGDRADIKKHAVAYVIGTFVLFAATQIILALVDIAGQLGGETGASST